MGRGDTQGRDSSSPAMRGLLCGRDWLVSLLGHMFVEGGVAAAAIRSETTSAGKQTAASNPIHGHVMWCVETRRGSIPPLWRCAACCVAAVGW